MKKLNFVVDTNVTVVANGKADHVELKCMFTCIDSLEQIRKNHRLLLDDKHLILKEYQKNLSPSGQPGPGDAFFKWVWDNQENPKYCQKVCVTPNEDRCFAEFPDDPRLSRFDRDDRIFVAVALASITNPTVLNASDTDWWDHHDALKEHGVKIKFLCRELMKKTKSA